MSAKLIVNPKDYKLKCSEEILKTLKPYFELKASSYSHYSQAQQLTNGHSSPDQQSVQPKQEAKTSINLTLRDANTGELLGKGQLIFDHTAEKPEKFEEKVSLKDILGNEIGEATVEVQQIKPQQPKKTIEDEFRRMRKEMQGMMRATNRMFDAFSRRHFGRDWGFGLLDDFHPMMMLGDDYYDDYDYEEHKPKEKVCSKCNCHEAEKKNELKGESMVHQLQNNSAPIVELASEANKEKVEVRPNDSVENKPPEVEISNEKN